MLRRIKARDYLYCKLIIWSLLLHVKLFLNLFVLHLGTLKVRLFLKFTIHEFCTGNKLYNLWLAFELISLNKCLVKPSLRL